MSRWGATMKILKPQRLLAVVSTGKAALVALVGPPQVEESQILAVGNKHTEVRGVG